MYNLHNMIGKVITIRGVGGQEYVGSLMAVDENNQLITVYRPRMVTIADDQVYMVPFALTALAEEVVMNLTQIFTILETIPETCTDYLALIEAEQATEEVVVRDNLEKENSIA
jgi:hypothetical protein